jgi:hypothetical protein
VKDRVLVDERVVTLFPASSPLQILEKRVPSVAFLGLRDANLGLRDAKKPPGA